jgi:hypothetical protein
MSERRYITLVFEWTEAVSKLGYNDTHLGEAVAVATGNLLTVNGILEDALGDIANGSCDAEDLAQDALDKANEHVLKHMRISPEARRQIEEGWKPDTATAKHSDACLTPQSSVSGEKE